MFKKIEKYLTIPKLVFLVQLITIFLVVLNFLPKDVFLFLTAFLIFYFLFEKTENSLIVFLASIPFFVALPLSDSFDHMANWRFFVLAISLSFVFRQKWLSLDLLKQKIKEKFWRRINIFEWLGIIFIMWLFVSLLEANSLFWGFKKIIFLLNILILYPILKSVFRKNKEFYQRVLKTLGLNAAVILGVALVQLVTVFFVPLFTFWQFWARRVIDFLYGGSLSDLLSYSNTWFSYYQSTPPTLRLFSIFPDSHSFAMFLILALPAIIFLWSFEQRRFYRVGSFLIALFSMMGIALSGSRGAWLSFVPAALVGILILFFYLRDRVPAKKNIFILSLFLLAFAISLIYPTSLYLAQSYQHDGEIDFKSLSFFERARSISDISETSNKGRIEIWDSSLKSISQKPFLGVGIGNFSQVLGEDVSTSKRGASAHNLFLDFGTEIGILGMILLIFLFLKILKMTWQIFDSQNESKDIKTLFIALLIYIVWVLSYSLFDVVLLNDKVLLVFVVWLALINYFYKSKRDEKKIK